MPAFVYTARTATGELKSATIEAASKEDVTNQLKRLRMTVVKVEEAAKSKPKTKGSVAMRDIVIFTRQFSTMINSGLPLVQALDILSKQSENPVLQAVTRQVVFDIESGHTVADALAKHPNAFTELYVNMVAAGEAGGPGPVDGETGAWACAEWVGAMRTLMPEASGTRRKDSHRSGGRRAMYDTVSRLSMAAR